MLTLILDEN